MFVFGSIMSTVVPLEMDQRTPKRHNLHAVELSQQYGNPLCKLCRPFLPPEMGDDLPGFFVKPAMRTHWIAG